VVADPIREWSQVVKIDRTFSITQDCRKLTEVSGGSLMIWRNWPVPGGWRICLQAETMLTPVCACVVAWQNLRLNSPDGAQAFCKAAKPGRIMNTDSRKLDSQPR